MNMLYTEKWELFPSSPQVHPQVGVTLPRILLTVHPRAACQRWLEWWSV